MKDNAAIQVWVCDHCPTVYRSPLALSFPPVHHCPSLRARLIRDFKLKQAEVNA